MDFRGARDYILERLKNELHPNLYYHSLEHTLDVHDAVCRFNSMENVGSHAGKLLETAALYHDAGMVIRYENHEDTSIDIASEILPRFGYSEEDTALVTRLIASTRIPQTPAGHYHDIICDADLDVLGRPDFFIRSMQLRLEWALFGIRHDTLYDWLVFQKNYLEHHKYFTASARKIRHEQKQKNIAELNEVIHHIIKNN